MTLQQGQVWQQNEGGLCFRIVVLERLAVTFKETLDPDSREGSHRTVTKKEFCRLIKDCTLLALEELPTRR